MSDQDNRLTGRKRAAESQLTPDNCNVVEVEEEANEPMVADAATLATRKIRKVRRPAGMEDPEDKQKDSLLGKAFAATLAAKPAGATVIAPAFTAGFAVPAPTAAAAAAPTTPAAITGSAPVTFGFGTPAATSGVTKAAPVTFGFGTAAPAANDMRASDFNTSTSTAPVTFGFGSKPPTAPVPAPAATTGNPVGILAAAKSGTFGSVFGAPKAAVVTEGGASKESPAPTGGFSFKIPEGCVAPPTAAPEPIVLPSEDEVNLITGEEGETTKFTAIAKLSKRSDGAWSERGTGEVKINQKTGADEKGGNSRLVMRDAATKRALLNYPLKTGFSIAKCEKGGLIFTVVESDGPQTFLLRILNGALSGEKQMAEAKTLLDAALLA